MKQLINIGTTPNDGTGDYLNLAGQKINNNSNDLYAGRANVHDFGAVGNGIADDTVAIQAAIDFAYANKIVHVYLPAGKYLTSAPIWVNPIANGRNPTSPFPTNGNWSLWLVGDGWGGTEFPGSFIFYTGSGTAVYFGPGQNIGAKDIAIIGTTGTRASFPTTKIGINVLASGGGAHIATFDGVQVSNFYQGFAFGLYVGTLDDSNTLLRCVADNCYYGFYTGSTQNFINELNHCAFQNCKWFVFSTANLGIQVTGGNYSTFNTLTCALPITSVMASWASPVTFTDTDPDQNGYANAEFTLVVGDPTDPAFAGSTANDVMASADIFAIDSGTHGIGVIPFKVQAYNTSTHTATLKFVQSWVYDRLGNGTAGLGAITNLPMELSVKAAAYLYVGDQITAFGSLGIHAKGIHIENDSCIGRIAYATPGWAVSTLLTLKDIYLNYDSSAQTGASVATNLRAYAIFILAQVWPVIQVNAGAEIDIDNCNAAGLWRLNIQKGFHSRIRNIPVGISSQIPYINILPGSYTSPSDGDGYRVSSSTFYEPTAESEWRGSGDADRWLFWDTTGYPTPRRDSVSRSPTVGYYPAPWVTPRLTPQLLDILLGTLPAVRFDQGAMLYDAVCGDCIYSLSHYLEPDPRNVFVKFHHVGWSWGQQLPYAWTYIAHTNVILLQRRDGLPPFTGDSNPAFGYSRFIFPGLVIGLDYSEFHIDSTTGVEFFTITAVHDFQGYIEVRTLADIGSTPQRTYTGTHITQQPFAVTKIGNQSANALTDATVAGRQYYVGDQIWQRTPVASGSMGWVCVTAGVAGSTAVFKTMPNLGP